MNCAHHVCRIGFDRVQVGAPHERLRSHVNYDLGLRLVDRLAEANRISHVALNGLHTPGHTRKLKQARRGWNGLRVAEDLCSERLKPEREPASLKARMACY